jgi:formylglycine-generating enzyme
MGWDKGSDDQRPEHKVFLRSFYIYKYPVTMAQFNSFCQSTGRRRHWTEHHLEGNHPAVNVSWYDAEAYANWAGVSLPSEAQWEKAARGTDGRVFPWGNTWETGRCFWQIPAYGDIYPPAPRGSYPLGASPFGVQEMVGNIWEWCSDWYDPTYYGHAPQENPSGPESGEERVTRGCGWCDMVQFPLNFSCMSRSSQSPNFQYKVHGFRCVSFGMIK